MLDRSAALRRKRKLTADRKRRYAQRKRDGVVMFSIEGNQAAIAELLIDGGFLKEWDAEKRDAVERALQDAVACWARG